MYDQHVIDWDKACLFRLKVGKPNGAWLDWQDKVTWQRLQEGKALYDAVMRLRGDV